MSGRTATRGDSDAAKLLAYGGRGNAQLGTDLPHAPTLGVQVGCTLNVHERAQNPTGAAVGRDGRLTRPTTRPTRRLPALAPLSAISAPAVLAAELERARTHHNAVRLHEAIGYVSPNDAREGRGVAIRQGRETGSNGPAASGAAGTGSIGTGHDLDHQPDHHHRQPTTRRRLRHAV
jgi:hypothetical protein